MGRSGSGAALASVTGRGLSTWLPAILGRFTDRADVLASADAEYDAEVSTWS
ncbi:hypothetical protein BH23ACT5_BH23ACT5_12080 [soil metagenome]